MQEPPPGDDRPDDVERAYQRLGAALFRYALMILADPAEADDVVQQVFMAFARRGAADLDSIDGYLKRAVRNESYSALRRRRLAPERIDERILEAVVAPDDRPDERLAIEQALGTLPADQREVIHLKVFEGLTFQDIADLTEVSINTVASRYRYAIDKLRLVLEKKS
jgi:RNA polymerase sigma-70 factor (ECF subfamily)